MALFNFRLRQIKDIQPWGDVLHWFGLSDGWFWLAAGGEEFPRFRTASPDEPPYVDYQVVRLWEDVLELLPNILEPVPADIAEAREAFAGDEVSEAFLAASEDGEQSVAFGWWGCRALDLGYLQKPPSVHFWRVGDVIHAAWAPHPGDRGLWTPTRGHSTFSADAFLSEVRAFDAAFLAAMADRVRAVVSAGGIPGVNIALGRLQAEQAERETWLTAALQKARKSQIPPAGTPARKSKTGAP